MLNSGLRNGLSIVRGVISNGTVLSYHAHRKCGDGDDYKVIICDLGKSEHLVSKMMIAIVGVCGCVRVCARVCRKNETFDRLIRSFER